MVLLVPALTLQIVEVVRGMPGYVEQATALLTNLQGNANDWLTGHGSPVLVDIGSALNPRSSAGEPTRSVRRS